MNVKLLRRIREHILAEPRRFLMRSWMLRKGWSGHDTFEPDTFFPRHEQDRVKFARCNTAACIGGWACLLEGQRLNKGTDARPIAKKMLRVNERQAGRLFSVFAWPVRLRNRYKRAKTQEDRVKIAAERIDHFISTKGAE